eukprot:jgi/Bigna1/79800/fgenesh1_pg.65_\
MPVSSAFLFVPNEPPSPMASSPGSLLVQALQAAGRRLKAEGPVGGRSFSQSITARHLAKSLVAFAIQGQGTNRVDIAICNSFCSSLLSALGRGLNAVREGVGNGEETPRGTILMFIFAITDLLAELHRTSPPDAKRLGQSLAVDVSRKAAGILLNSNSLEDVQARSTEALARVAALPSYRENIGVSLQKMLKEQIQQHLTRGPSRGEAVTSSSSSSSSSSNFLSVCTFVEQMVQQYQQQQQQQQISGGSEDEEKKVEGKLAIAAGAAVDKGSGRSDTNMMEVEASSSSSSSSPSFRRFVKDLLDISLATLLARSAPHPKIGVLTQRVLPCLPLSNAGIQSIVQTVQKIWETRNKLTKEEKEEGGGGSNSNSKSNDSASGASNKRKTVTTKAVVATQKSKRRGRGTGSRKKSDWSWLCFSILCHFYARLGKQLAREIDGWMVRMCKAGVAHGDPLIRKRARFLVRARLALGLQRPVDKGGFSHRLWIAFLDILEAMEEHGLHLNAEVWERAATSEILHIKDASMVEWAHLMLRLALKHKNQAVRRHVALKFCQEAVDGGGGDDDDDEKKNGAKEATKRATADGNDKKKREEEGKRQLQQQKTTPQPLRLSPSVTSVFTVELVLRELIPFLNSPSLYRFESERKMAVVARLTDVIQATLNSIPDDRRRRVAVRQVVEAVSRIDSHLALASLLKALGAVRPTNAVREGDDGDDDRSGDKDSEDVKSGEGNRGNFECFLSLISRCRRVCDVRVRRLYMEMAVGFVVSQLDLSQLSLTSMLRVLHPVPHRHLLPGQTVYERLRQRFQEAAAGQGGGAGWMEKIVMTGLFGRFLDGDMNHGDGAAGEVAAATELISEAKTLGVLLRLLPARSEAALERAAIDIITRARRAFSHPYASQTMIVRVMAVTERVLADDGPIAQAMMIASRGCSSSGEEHHKWIGEILSRVAATLSQNAAPEATMQPLLWDRAMLPVAGSILTSLSQFCSKLFRDRMMVEQHGEGGGIRGVGGYESTISQLALRLLAAVKRHVDTTPVGKRCVSAISRGLFGLDCVLNSAAGAKLFPPKTAWEVLHRLLYIWDAVDAVEVDEGEQGVGEEKKRKAVAAAAQDDQHVAAAIMGWLWGTIRNILEHQGKALFPWIHRKGEGGAADRKQGGGLRGAEKNKKEEAEGEGEEEEEAEREQKRCVLRMWRVIVRMMAIGGSSTIVGRGDVNGRANTTPMPIPIVGESLWHIARLLSPVIWACDTVGVDGDAGGGQQQQKQQKRALIEEMIVASSKEFSRDVRVRRNKAAVTALVAFITSRSIFGVIGLHRLHPPVDLDSARIDPAQEPLTTAITQKKGRKQQKRKTNKKKQQSKQSQQQQKQQRAEEDGERSSPLTRCLNLLIEGAMISARGSGYVAVVFLPAFTANLAHTPAVLGCYVKRMVALLTAYDKDMTTLPPALMGQLRALYEAHLTHMLNKDIKDRLYILPEEPHTDVGITASAMCRATSLICLETLARSVSSSSSSPPPPPSSSSSSRREAASFLAYVLRMLMRMNFDEDFVPCKGKMAFMDSPTSLRATYLWIALAALSPHLMEIQNASLEEKHSRRSSSSSKPQGAAKVGPTRGDTGQPPNMPLIDELGNAAWKCLRNTQTPALRHFVEAFLVNVFSIQPELIDTLLLPGLESTSIRPTIFRRMWNATMSHLSSNYGHIRTATQFLLVKVQNGMQSVLDPSLIKEGSPYTQLLRQLEANQEYRNLFTKISRYFDMFNPLRSGNLGQMLEWSTSSPLLNERLPLSLLDRIRPEIQETLTRIRFDYDESAPDEWLAFQDTL